MKYLKGFGRFTEASAAAEPATAPEPATKPAEPSTKPDTKPEPRPSPFTPSRERPVETPDPLGRSDSDDDVKNLRGPKKANAEQVAERFIELSMDKGMDIKKYIKK